MAFQRIRWIIGFILQLAWNNIITDGAVTSDNFILVADSGAGAIFQLDRNGTKVTRVNWNTTDQNPVDVAYSPVNNRIYWSDMRGFAIRSSNLDGTDVKAVVQLTDTSNPEGLAIDATAGFLFFTDQAAKLISIVKLDGTDRKGIISRDLVHPRSIRVDPRQRQIYWADWGTNTIERANYDGTSRQILYQTNSSWLNSLALDLQNRRVYWLDAQSDIIQTADMDGGDNIVTLLDARVTPPAGYTIKDDPHFYGLALDSEFVYVTDWERRGIFTAKKVDGSDFKLLHRTFLVPSGVMVYRSSLHVTGHVSECSSGTNKNGGCSNLCIPTPDSYVCACPDYQRLSHNGKTCLSDLITVGPDIIWVAHDSLKTSYIIGRHGDPTVYLPKRERGSAWSVRSPLWHWTSITNDYRRNLLYLADREDNLIVSLELNSNLSIDVIHVGTSAHVNGIALDWVARNIYWTDSLFNWIVVAKAEVKTPYTKTLVNSGLDKPHGIAVWPQKGLLVWTDWGVVNKLEVSTLAGENRHILADTNLKKPTGITIDTELEKIYWCNEDSIEVINADGSGRLRVGLFTGSNLVALTHYKNFLFATDQGSQTGVSIPAKLIIVNTQAPREPYPSLLLNRIPYGITMLSRAKQEHITDACTTLGCEQLCVSAVNNSAQCLCKDGFDLQNDEKTCTENGKLFSGPSIIYALADRLCAVSVQNAVTRHGNPDDRCFFVDGRNSFRALDYHYGSGYLYFSEVNQRVRSIRRAHMKNMTDNMAVIHGTGVVKGLVVDWTANNLYWTDYDRGQVWVSRLDGSYQKILVNGVARPHGIALDQKGKKLYWSEQGTMDSKENPQPGAVKRANMDGSNIITIELPGVQQPAGLAVDVRLRRLYWVDQVLARISWINVDTLSNRTPVALPPEVSQPDRQLYDISVFQDYLMYSQSGPNNQSGVQLVQLDPIKQLDVTMFHRQQNHAYSVIVFSQQNQANRHQGQQTTSCFYDNGGCQQLCLQHPNGKTCACVDGMKPNDTDISTCVPATPLEDHFFLVTDDYRSQIYQFGPTVETSSVSSFPLASTERPIAIAYDFTEKRVYWTDFNNGLIKRAFLDGSSVEIVFRAGVGSRIDGLAFDHESRILYYTDTGLGYIGIVSPSGSYHTILVSTGLASPRAIVLDPKSGFMFYTARNTSNGRIERRNMDGSAPVSIINKKLSWPNGLAVDFEGRKLYWIDAHSERIEVANLDGSDRRLIFEDERESDPFGLAVQGEHVYWTDWTYSGIFQVRKTGQAANSSVYHADLFRGLNDLKFFNKSALRGPNPCTGRFNGGCSHFCLRVPGARVCACPLGFRIGTDEATCQEVSTCPQTIGNGRLDPACSRELNAECAFYCNDGYVKITMKTITCLQGMTWSMDVNQVCVSQVCPLLTRPPNTVENRDCPLVGYPGITCTHSCSEGFEMVGGSPTRTCTDDLEWTGEDLQCTRVYCPPLHLRLSSSMTIRPLTCIHNAAPPGESCHQKCQEGTYPVSGTNVRVCGHNGAWSGLELQCRGGEGSTSPPLTSTLVPGAQLSSGRLTTPIIIGIVVACAALVCIIILIAVLVARKHAKRTAWYRNSPNIQEIQTPPRPNGSQEFHYGQNDVSPSYDVKTDTVNLEGKLSYSNPGYENTEGITDDGNQPTPTPKQPDKMFANNNGTSFDNPLYAEEKDKMEAMKQLDKVLKGESVKPDLTRELSSI